MNLSKKRIVVTGGSMGIGLACAEACLAAGARVLIAARTEGPLMESLAALRKKGFSTAEAVVADATQPEQVRRLFQTAIQKFGGLDGVIHCAGIYGPIGPVTETDPAEWLEAIRVNLFGTFLVAKEACQIMKKAGGGRIVLLSGGGAATPFPNYTAYASSKAAVVRFTETLALEMQPFGVEINCLAPGFVITRLHQQTLEAGKKAGEDFLQNTQSQIKKGGVPPTVAAGAAAFLLCDGAAGITGKFVAAPYDGWASWPEHLEQLKKTDIFTLRRILPKDRGMDWQ